jgi:flagellar protein FliT
MTGSELLGFYGQLAATMAAMVQVARELRWSQLPPLDARCTELFVQLREAQVPAGGFSAPDRQRLEALTHRIGEDQQALQALLQPQFRKLVQRVAEIRAAR